MTGTPKKKDIKLFLGEPLTITLLVTKVFDSLQIRYFVGGSLASSLHGIPRATQDIDIIAELETSHILPFITDLQDKFYVDADMIEEAIKRKSSFNIIHLETMFKVDIFISKKDKRSHEEMNRRQEYDLEANYKLFVASPEDIILAKLYWYKLGGEISDKQWNDIQGVFQVQKETLNISYLNDKAKEMKLLNLLFNALKEASVDEK